MGGRASRIVENNFELIIAASSARAAKVGRGSPIFGQNIGTWHEHLSKGGVTYRFCPRETTYGRWGGGGGLAPVTFSVKNRRENFDS